MDAYYQNDILLSSVENLTHDFLKSVEDMQKEYKQRTGKNMQGTGRILFAVKNRGVKAYLISSIAKGPRGYMVDFLIQHKLYQLLDEAVVLRHKDAFADAPEAVSKAAAILRSITGEKVSA